MQNRIKQLLKQKGHKSKWLADVLNAHPTTISRLINGKMELDITWMRRIAGALGVKPTDSLVDSDDVIPPDLSISRHLPADVPVRGTAAGAPLSSGLILVDQTEPIAWVRRPPGATLARELYALHVVNSSMEPRYYEGDLIYIDPNREARPGDHVIILTERYAGAGQECYVKKLLRIADKRILTQQYNPPAEVEFVRANVVAIHRILNNNELYGL